MFFHPHPLLMYTSFVWVFIVTKSFPSSLLRFRLYLLSAILEPSYQLLQKFVISSRNWLTLCYLIFHLPFLGNSYWSCDTDNSLELMVVILVREKSLGCSKCGRYRATPVASFPLQHVLSCS